VHHGPSEPFQGRSGGADNTARMIRGVGLRSAVAVNVVTMIGAGPLITIPLVVVALHGSVSVIAWVIGAAIALCDGLVYAELASRLPRSGGTYAYLREGYGPRGAGRLIAFVFVWQFCFWAPLTLASGYIGFAQYAGFLVPALTTNIWLQKAVALCVGLITIVALYRAIPTIARTAYVLGFVAVATLLVVAFAGLSHPHIDLASLAPHAFSFNGIGFAALGAALVITLYDYGGYADVCAIAEEVKRPERTIPLAILISVAIVALCYIALNLGVFSTLAADRVAKSTSVASDVIDKTLGHRAAIGVTIAVLITAFASTYGLLLGASRIPFAAARDGDFLPMFARLHPTGKFPGVSLLVLGLLALPATFLPLDLVINALTAGIALIQGAAQIGALVLLRRKTPPAPFRIPLYPVPPLIALLGWVYLFLTSGTLPILLGTGSLFLGVLVFLVHANRSRIWPFATALLVALVVCSPRPTQGATFTHSMVVQRDGNPTLMVDGKPFFFYGAAFFYERIPAAQWKWSMQRLKTMGFNTLDLYVPWNWHELRDGDFDFDGHTNPQRNLREVLRLAAQLDFRLLVRPGPVIRNEWRNGGYPAWLLTRPEYGMPLHDVLEGRYPATATLQNANSDDAAAEWMRNTTHMQYAARWLQTSLKEFLPVADRVLAVQLDDDQGAYIDNQTWPAPHFQTYIRTLESITRTVVGPQLPAFINTYEMKVTASAPVWAMGNWYQSDAYSIGEHDRTQLEFSTGLLQTQTRWPVAISEFQAGWLAPPEDPQPRPADPTNTTLALHTLLGMGVRGVIDFPVQDTVNPAGWEAPFANASYAWGAALTAQLLPSDRYGPTQDFGAIVKRYGNELAGAQRVSDGAIAYMTSAFPETSMTNALVFAIAARTQGLQQHCRAQALTCDLADLRYISDERLRNYRFLVVPTALSSMPIIESVRAKLARYAKAGGRVISAIPHVAQPVNGGIADAILLRATDGAAFLDIVNYSNEPRTVASTSTGGPNGMQWIFDSRVIPPRSAVLTRLDTHGNDSVALSHGRQEFQPNICGDGYDDPTRPRARVNVFNDRDDGFPRVYITNDEFGAEFSPLAGARLIGLGEVGAYCTTLFSGPVTSVGALRDDVEIQPPLSTTDRIGKYTRSFPAGMFNRPYRVETIAQGEAAIVKMSYDAPDIVPNGATFERTISLTGSGHRITIDQRATFNDGPGVAQQRAITLSSFDTRNGTLIDDSASGSTGIFYPATHTVAIVTWRAGDIEDARIIPERTSSVLRLRLAPGGTRRTVMAIAPAADLNAAHAAMQKEQDLANAKP
jgi:amino acid transporter